MVTESDRVELLLRTSRRLLVVLLLVILFIAATLIAHVLRPGSLLADWAGRAPWLLPMFVAGMFMTLVVPIRRRFRPDGAETTAMRNDEFRQANLGRAQRTALVAVLVAQIPLAILVSGLTTTAAVTIMGVATVTVAMTTVIIAFLWFDRD